MNIFTAVFTRWQQSPAWLRLSSALVTGLSGDVGVAYTVPVAVTTDHPALPAPLQQQLQRQAATLSELQTATLRLQEKKAVAEH